MTSGNDRTVAMAFWAERERKAGKQAQERYSCSTCFSAQASNTRAGCCCKQLHKHAGDAGKMTCRLSSLSTQLRYRIETLNHGIRSAAETALIKSLSLTSRSMQVWSQAATDLGKGPMCLYRAKTRVLVHLLCCRDV